MQNLFQHCKLGKGEDNQKHEDKKVNNAKKCNGYTLDLRYCL